MANARRAVQHCLDHAPRPIPPDSLVHIAVSGGPDSLALAVASSFVVPRAGHHVEAVIVDHGLQSGSGEVAATAAKTVESLGITAHVVAVDIDDSGNIEARAREARYEALDQMADQRGAAAILLGHTLDDQAETVLLGLTRGSGPASIQGMPEYSGRYWRPFLGLTRQETCSVCEDAGVTWWDDPHNSDDRFVRPRIRHHVMPVLEQHLGPGVAQALVRTGMLVGRDRVELDAQARALADTFGDGVRLGRIPRGALHDVPLAIASRAVRIVAEESIGSHLDYHHTVAVVDFMTGKSGPSPIEIPGGRVEKHADYYRFVPRSGRYRREE